MGMRVEGRPRGRRPIASHPAVAAGPGLRGRLVAADLAAVTASTLTWVVLAALLGARPAGLAVGVGAATLLPVSMAAGRLYRRATCREAVAEFASLVQVVLWHGLLASLVAALLGHGERFFVPASAVATAGLGVAIGRQFFRDWLAARRAAGDHVYPTVLVASRDGVAYLRDLIDRHPSLGFDVVASLEPDDQLLARLEQVLDDDAMAGASVIVALPDLDELQRHAVLRLCASRDVHVHVRTSSVDLAQTRLRQDPLVTDAMFYVDHAPPSRRSLLVKRAIDLVVASLLLVALSPVLLASAIAIAATSRGGVLFRQERVGHDGQPFVMLKLRTMIEGAAEQLADVRHLNARSGPLLKVVADPRITPVGRFLRATSLDELPQLFNVVRGDMSLIGPRPALPSEAEAFDDELRERFEVRPGVSGLWQVEARDHPDFDLYRRYDLYYVRNWSLALDCVIALRTVTTLVHRALRMVGQRDDVPGTPHRLVME